MATAEKLFLEAEECYKQKDFEQALVLYTGAADLGHVPAYSCVGYAYLYGEGTEKDYAKAVEYFKKGEQVNNASCISNLGFCYSNGYGVAQDKRKAMELYKRAADGGSEQARKNYESLKKELGNDPEAPQNKNADLNRMFAELFGSSSDPSGSMRIIGVTEKSPTHLAVTVELILCGPADGTTTLPVKLPQYGIDQSVVFPNNLQEFQVFPIRNVLANNGSGKSYDLTFVPTKITRMTTRSTSKDPNVQVNTGVGGLGVSNREKSAPREKKDAAPDYVKKLKRRVSSNYVFCYVCAVICAACILVGRFTGTAPVPLVVLLVLTLYPGLGGILATPGFIKRIKHLKSLEHRGLLELAAKEMYTGKTVPFGDKALLSEHFLFRKSKKGFAIPCEDILWFYTGKVSRYCDFYVGTRYNGVTAYSGVSRYVKNFDAVVNAAAGQLQSRTKDLLINNTPANKEEYHRRIYQK